MGGGGSGGKRPGAGRPKGARNRRATALIAEAERTGQLLPIDYLLSVMRDPDAEPRDRMSAAGMAAPYCHPRLTVMQAFSDPRHLDDLALSVQFSRLEQRVGEVPESDHIASVSDQLEQLLDALPELPPKRQEALLRKLAAASEAGLQANCAALGGNRSISASARVDLPLPLSPTKPTTAFSGMSMSTLRNTCAGPRSGS